ncbi:MAG: hypothetical protein E6J73_21655 [Deltaproteobacteria bacterium]|nr:MAG: hypothetical protein E6J73_21655 [Deltaproteobacteria bacterium]
MKKLISLIAMSLLAGSLTIPSGRVYANENPPGNHRQREELRRDRQQLEQLRQRRNHELREGDRREAREYNETTAADGIVTVITMIIMTDF